jgi:hypothetical protein
VQGAGEMHAGTYRQPSRSDAGIGSPTGLSASLKPLASASQADFPETKPVPAVLLIQV